MDAIDKDYTPSIPKDYNNPFELTTSCMIKINSTRFSSCVLVSD
jgi:hypothetical protein